MKQPNGLAGGVFGESARVILPYSLITYSLSARHPRRIALVIIYRSPPYGKDVACSGPTRTAVRATSGQRRIEQARRCGRTR